jgi:hypothetical protein
VLGRTCKTSKTSGRCSKTIDLEGIGLRMAAVSSQGPAKCSDRPNSGHSGISEAGGSAHTDSGSITYLPQWPGYGGSRLRWELTRSSIQKEKSLKFSFAVWACRTSGLPKFRRYFGMASSSFLASSATAARTSHLLFGCMMHFRLKGYDAGWMKSNYISRRRHLKRAGAGDILVGQIPALRLKKFAYELVGSIKYFYELPVVPFA